MHFITSSEGTVILTTVVLRFSGQSINTTIDISYNISLTPTLAINYVQALKEKNKELKNNGTIIKKEQLVSTARPIQYVCINIDFAFS